MHGRTHQRSVGMTPFVRTAWSVGRVPASCPWMVVTAVAVSLFAYFFYMVAAFSGIAALLIGLSNESTVQGVIHYPRPIFDQAAIAPDSGAWHVPNAPNRTRNKESPAKDKRDDKMDSRAIAVAKANAPIRNSEIKRNVVKFARLQKPRAPARPRERRDRGYAVASAVPRDRATARDWMPNDEPLRRADDTLAPDTFG
jgi:hypothetical protein